MAQLKYGDIALFVNRGVAVYATVIQSALVNIEDKSQANGIRTEEHLTLTYLKPELAAYTMSGADIDRAITKVFGVIVLEDHPEKQEFPYALHELDAPALAEGGALPVPLNPHPELIQHSPEHKPQVPALRSRAPFGKVENSNPDGGAYVPEAGANSVEPEAGEPPLLPESTELEQSHEESHEQSHEEEHVA